MSAAPYILRKPTLDEAVERVWDDDAAMDAIHAELVDELQRDKVDLTELLIAGLDAFPFLQELASRDNHPERYLHWLVRELELWANRREQKVCEKAEETLS